MKRARLPEVSLQIETTFPEETIYAWASIEPVRFTSSILTLSDTSLGCGFRINSRLDFRPGDVDVSEWKAFGLEYGGYR